MRSKATQIQVPYDRNGNLMHYAGYDPNWQPNTPFAATLHLTGTERGRSATYFMWADDDGRRYPMFITDVSGLLQSTAVQVNAGRVTATWLVQKRGENYGLRLATPAEVEAAASTPEGTTAP